MSGNTVLVGVTMMWEIHCLLSESGGQAQGPPLIFLGVARDTRDGPAVCCPVKSQDQMPALDAFRPKQASFRRVGCRNSSLSEGSREYIYM